MIGDIMGIKENVLDYLISHPGDHCDDCLSNLLHITPRQTINIACRTLQKENKVKREKTQCSTCGAYKVTNTSGKGGPIVTRPRDIGIVQPTKIPIAPEILSDFNPGGDSIDNVIKGALGTLIVGVRAGTIEIYNEASVQYELAIIFRRMVGEDYNIHLERNIEDYGLNKSKYIKKEMDICLRGKRSNDLHCIELKFPRKGQYPEQMFKVCEDIMFLEQLKAGGFGDNYFILLTDLPNFYSNAGGGQIYELFRKEKKLYGTIEKPTGEKCNQVRLSGVYEIAWQLIHKELAYFMIRV